MKQKFWILSVCFSIHIAITLSAATEAEAWQAVMDAANHAASLGDQEKQANGDAAEHLRKRRIEAYGKAEDHLRGYILQWTPDETSLAYLKALCALAVYRENAERRYPAFVAYDACLQHEEIANPSAVYSGRKIAAVAGEGISRTILEQDQQLLLSLISFRQSKGSIEAIDHLADDSKPFTPRESLAFSLRLRSRGETNQAVETGKTLLSRAGLLYELYASPDLVLFGVSARPNDAAEFGKILDQEYTNYKRLFLPADTTAPLLVVYANLGYDGEPVGQKLSKAIHGREMDGIEGYYYSLDHSLVLRKGLRNGIEGPLVSNKFFSGTALHELLHATIAYDYADAPVWLNEGLAAVHEEQENRLPIDNYRLYYLLEAEKRHKLPDLDFLLSAAPENWKHKGQPLLAAMARYFCLFVWVEHDLSPPVLYKRMREARAKSNTSGNQLFEEATGLRLRQLNAPFLRFIHSRPLNRVDHKWARLRDDIKRYVEKMPALERQ